MKTHRLRGLLLLLAAPLLTLAARAETTLTPYGCWDNLGFEESPPLNISDWSSNGTALTYINDSSQAHTGHGAVKMDGTAPISVWGGPASTESEPHTGDTVGGSFWIKLLSTPQAGASVDVRMNGYINNVETVYCHTASIDLSTLPLNTWTKVNLVSAGNTYAAGSNAGFNIVSAGGVACLIDDIVYGAITTTSTPVSVSDTAVVPGIRDYAGSTFNADFEVGNAYTGNSYWGQYTPNQSAISGSPLMMNFITSAAGTAPGASKSGTNMISVIRGGIAWNIANLSSSTGDQLPRVGDLVGGSCWIYVPTGADPPADLPVVSFIYKTAAGDVTVADTSAVTAASLVKGAWNRLPILPNGKTIDASATSAGIIVTGPQLNSTTNPLYAAPYYVDDIRVGSIAPAIAFAPASGLVDGTGAAITAPASTDTILRAKAIVQNASGSTAVNGYLVLDLYEQTTLKTSAIQPVTIAAKGSAGLSFTTASIQAALSGLDLSKLNVRLRLCSDSALRTPIAGTDTLLQQTRDYAPTDAHIRYLGRWSPEGSAYRGNWVRPYFKVNFTGSTSVQIRLLQSASLSVLLDGTPTTYNSVNGLVSLGANLDASASHTLRVAGLTWQDAVLFDAIRLDDVGTLQIPAVANDRIEFIGDSITAWNNGYSWLVPERLGVEGSRICWPGIALVDGFGYYTVPAGYSLSGMASAYFLNGMPGYGTAGNWDFSAYTPRVVVVNLGTNDFAAITGNTTLVSNFRSNYQTLLTRVRAKFPSTELFVIRPFTITAADVQTAIAAAVQNVINAGDTHLHYVDTTSWNIAIGEDGIHPTDAGHVAIADKLVPIISPYLSGGVQARAPVITSAPSATFTQGAAASFTVTASGSPAATFSADGLPAWAALDTATGRLTGTPPQAGAWTITLHAANGVSPAATQTFTATVTSSLAQWKTAHFTTAQLADPAVSGTAATPQNDGVPNLLKYAFGIDPATAMTAAARELLPQVAMRTENGTAYLSLTYVLNNWVDGITCRLESSDDLQTWQTRTPDILRYLASNQTDGYTMLEAEVRMDDTPRRFLRLNVSMP